MTEIIELSKKLHMTETAETLHISQQTLSNHIARLESYYDVILFERRPKLTLTYSGEIFLKYAMNLLSEEQNLIDTLSDIKHKNFGKIKFGAGLARGKICLSEIIDTFNQKFPNVEVKLCDALSNDLEKSIEMGDIDCAIVIENYNKSLQEYNYFHDQIYLCVSDKLLKKYYDSTEKDIKVSCQDGVHLKYVKDLPFSLYNNRIGKLIKDCFLEESCKPFINISTPFSLIQLELCLKHISACFLTQMALSNLPQNFLDQVNIFPLKQNGESLYVKVSIIHNLKKMLTSHSKYFLLLLQEYFENLKNFDFTNIIQVISFIQQRLLTVCKETLYF